MTAFSDAVDALTPLAYYRCEDTSGNLVDSSGNDSTATASAGGTASYLQPGADGYGLKVVGTKYWDATLASAVVDDVTMFAMIKRAATYSTFGNIMSLGDDDQGGQMRLNPTTLIIEVIRADAQHCASSTIAVPRDGRWHSVCVTKAALAAPKIYIDGADVTAVSPADGTAWASTTALKIGARGNGSDRPLSGNGGAYIDEVWVLNAESAGASITALDALASNAVASGDDRRRRR